MTDKKEYVGPINVWIDERRLHFKPLEKAKLLGELFSVVFDYDNEEEGFLTLKSWIPVEGPEYVPTDGAECDFLICMGQKFYDCTGRLQMVKYVWDISDKMPAHQILKFQVNSLQETAIKNGDK